MRFTETFLVLKKIFIGGTFAASIASLTGCIALAFAPAVPLVGGMMEGENEIVIDETTVDPTLRQLLSVATKISFLTNEGAAAYTAEYLEMHDAYTVTVEAPATNASPSQTMKHMEKICRNSDRPHLVFSFASPMSDAGTGTTVKSLLTGRIDFNLDILTNVIRCRNGWTTQFALRGEFDQGMYNSDITKLNQAIGTEFAKALMRVAGKLPPKTES